MAASGMTFKSTHTRAGMSKDTLNRRPAAPEALTIGELRRLADAMRASICDLLPDLIRTTTLAPHDYLVEELGA